MTFVRTEASFLNPYLSPAQCASRNPSPLENYLVLHRSQWVCRWQQVGSAISGSSRRSCRLEFVFVVFGVLFEERFSKVA